MGQCYGKNISVVEDRDDGIITGGGGVNHRPQTPSSYSVNGSVNVPSVKNTPVHSSSSNSNSQWPSPYPHGVGGASSPLPPGINPSPARSSRSTPRRFFRRPFPPPSPAKHIKAALAKRQGAAVSAPPKEGPIPEDGQGGAATEDGRQLDKSFGYGKNFGAKYELGKEIGRGHFGHTCSAKVKKGEFKGQQVAVKIISKAKMTTAISIEDVRREVKILKALSGHMNLVRFHDACEDANNVYIVMELCEGGELLDRILSRGGRYNEEDAKIIVLQILSVVAFCHLQGVVHRDLKPENFLFTTRDENASMKLIDFGLSDFIRPDGDARKQELLAKIAMLQTMKVRLTDYLDERSAYLTQFAEEANAEFDEIGENALKGLDEAEARILENIEGRMQAFEETAESNREEIEQDEKKLVEFEDQIEKELNEGLFFKNLTQKKAPVDQAKAKEETEKLKEITRYSAGSSIRKNVYLALMTLLSVGIFDALITGSDWRKVAILGAIFVALFYQFTYENGLSSKTGKIDEEERKS